MPEPETKPQRPAEKWDGEPDIAPGQPPADVENRPNVSTVEPEDYPKGLPDH